ncbi:MAG: arginine repressor [Lachnospiraceae bacterium]|nr:arginine repressor [Lachnospiraceae bacterium]
MKNARHQQILFLIREHDVETQEELAELLNKTGFTVTQATVSRDIRQLQLQKVHTDNGRQKYVRTSEGDMALGQRYLRALQDAFVSLDLSGNIMVLHTISGMAMSVAAAIDSLDWNEVLGCIAGDDTIMIVLRSPEAGDSVKARIMEIVS